LETVPGPVGVAAAEVEEEVEEEEEEALLTRPIHLM
jgi:hypothetical protein